MLTWEDCRIWKPSVPLSQFEALFRVHYRKLCWACWPHLKDMTKFKTIFRVFRTPVWRAKARRIWTEDKKARLATFWNLWEEGGVIRLSGLFGACPKSRFTVRRYTREVEGNTEKRWEDDCETANLKSKSSLLLVVNDCSSTSLSAAEAGSGYKFRARLEECAICDKWSWGFKSLVGRIVWQLIPLSKWWKWHPQLHKIFHISLQNLKSKDSGAVEILSYARSIRRNKLPKRTPHRENVDQLPKGQRANWNGDLHKWFRCR